jgi:hypothetical protein
MTLAALVKLFRTLAKDTVAPYFWADADVTAWLNEAQAEAAVRGRLIHESANADVCQIAVVAGTSVYALHAALFEITYQAFIDESGRRVPIQVVSIEWLDDHAPRWREDEGPGVPQWLIQTDRSLRVAPAPKVAGTIVLEGYRLPLGDLVADTDVPEINAAHHRHLVDWALYRAFSIPDSESFDAQRAGQAEAAFSAYFGLAPDADLRRSAQADAPQTTEAFWP